MIKNIVFIGASGCGKTTLGHRLSYHINWNFVDTDVLIEKNAGMKISEIFAKFGEPHFRELEKAAIKKASEMSNTVIATGGGCVKNEENMRALKENGIIIYLEASPEKIYSNIKNNKTRPLLQTDDKLGAIRKHLEERKPLYEKYADITLNISKGTRETNVRKLYDIYVKKIKNQ